MNEMDTRFANQFNIQWFPGHMTKTLRMMEQEIQHVDASLVLLDARIPLSSLNPEIERITARKPKLYALNKADLADPAVTEEWIKYFRAADAGCVAISAKQKGGATAVKYAIEKELSAHNVDLTTLDAVCARGGQLPYCAAGTYLVDQDMVDFMYTVRDAAHASNLGCVLALRIARPLGIPAFICDPVTVDEMTDEARISGHPMLPRMMTGHALNCRAMALRCAETVLHKPLADCRLIVLHLGGGGSARLFIGGKMVDGVRDDEWMFAPERMGGVSLQPLVAMCYSGAYTKQDIMDLIRGKGGLMAHLGTANAQEVEQRIADGDAHVKLVYDGMLYSCARAIGGLAAAADGRVDRIILTGGLAHSHYVTGYLTQKLSFIAPVEVMAGEFELEALAAGASRVLNGQEQPRRFADIPQA